ncbi:unnamed protein product, partial [Gulo gulo]
MYNQTTTVSLKAGSFYRILGRGCLGVRRCEGIAGPVLLPLRWPLNFNFLPLS